MRAVAQGDPAALPAHRLSDVAGMLLTHEHQDHAKAVTDLARRGIDCYMTEGTARPWVPRHRIS